MKKVILLTCVVAVLLTLPVAMAKKGDTPANDNPNNLYLYEKDADWNIVWDGAWGKMNYTLDGTTIDCVFNGHGLEKKTDYTLISYNDPWPGSPVFIATGRTNNGGNINIKASGIDLGKEEGIKIWLVLTDDLGADGMTGWNPSEYLFEHNLIP